MKKSCPQRPLVFMGHCFGGLVIEKALISAKLHDTDFPGVVQSTAGVIFLGTPHRGSKSQSKAAVIAAIASAMGCGEDTSLLKAVEKDSEMLHDLLYDFTRTVNTASIPLFCFFEQHKSDISKIVKPRGSFLPAYKELVVDENSGCIDGFPKLGLACDHFQMCKFSDPENPNFRLICQEIRSFVDTAPERVRSRLNPSDIARQMSAIEEERDLACLRALFITDPLDDMEKIQNKQDKLLEGTGAWVLSDSTFTSWLNSDIGRLLWLHGDPGKGKTMLAISLVKDLTEKVRLQGSATTSALAYFFCDNKDSRRKTCTSVLRGLIYQLICQRPELCVHLREQYEKQKEHLFSSPNAAQSLWRIFRDIVSSESLQQIYIVIDALDECEIESIDTLLTLIDPASEPELTDLADHALPPSGPGGSTKVKWLVISRNDIAIKQTLAESLGISLEDNETYVTKAVRQFIVLKTNHLQHRKNYNRELRHIVESQLLEKAEGTFLWVALACRELAKPRVLSVNTMKVLSQLPSGLTPMYERIMEQILVPEDEELVEIAKSIFRAMVVAFRPLSLGELGLVADLPTEHRHNIPVISEYVSQCGSMVTVRDHVVYFVHLSAKTFIQTMSSTQIVSSDISTDHEFLALKCFAYICKELSKDHHRLSHLHDIESGETEIEYPIHFWLDHTRSSSLGITRSFDLCDPFFDGDSVQRQLWFEIYWTKVHAKWESCPSSFSALHLAAYATLPWLVQALLQEKGSTVVHALDSLGNTPLLWAAKNGCRSSVQMLLEAGSDRSHKNHEGMNALQWAAGNGHVEVLQALFDGKESLEITDKNGWTPLHRAAYNGHVQVVRQLLDFEANIEKLDGSTWTALTRSSSSGQTEVVKLLLDKGASIHTLDREGMTPMLHAAWGGHTQVVRMHLEKGCDVNHNDFNDWTALHNVSSNGHVDAAKFLLKKGANVQARNTDGSTPLHFASWSGQHEVATTLIDAGAHVDAEDDEGETPLQQAAWRGHRLTSKAIIDAGADVDKKNAVGHTALHQAASSGEEFIVSMLLESGADPTQVDKYGQSARALAETNEHDNTANLIKIRERELVISSVRTDTPVDRHPLDEAVAEALGIQAISSIAEPHQAAGFFLPEKITALVDGKRKLFYMKSGSNKEMFESEHLSLMLLHKAVPTLSPKPLAWGKFKDSNTWYLVTEWVDLEANEEDTGMEFGLTLAQKVAKLHTTIAPVPEGHKTPMFGFPITTYCGSTPVNNTYCGSWAKFYSEYRLRALAQIIEENHGTDKEFTDALNILIDNVVPKLLGNGHLGGKQGISPVLIHGDLWEGNKAKAKFDDRNGLEPVTFDPACSYSHSEFELGLMRMFGGFSAGFFNEYHHLIPKTEPKKEYEDRMQLYEL
ncbi:uncharacterized protein KY384_003575 [Bacidia gigantensis]|uniref:uncharacterized protein n=1 Tax=Bacidia gigantensis TaxID=2732470 RepID=UPI001D046AD9|nr:uncharacterized protein KY384_003575 [Bacidia gigantensis]KAG8531939.1 hypothetical protein KY384_003575 [Bacidia gigantensis]